MYRSLYNHPRSEIADDVFATLLEDPSSEYLDKRAIDLPKRTLNT